jgi:hypothetical protein
MVCCNFKASLFLLQTMKWRRKSPFGGQDAAAEHMIVLLSREADRHGTPLNETEKKLLASESARGEPFPEDLRLRSHKLIEEILEREKTTDIKNDPKSFLASFSLSFSSHEKQSSKERISECLQLLESLVR